MINRVTLIGRIGQQPKQHADGRIVTFSLATSERIKKDEKYENITTWHNISSFNQGLNVIIMKFCDAGDLVYVEGQLRYNKYKDKNGQQRESAQISLGFDGILKILDSKKQVKDSKVADDELNDEVPF